MIALKQLWLGILKFFVAGHGMSRRTGKFLFISALLGGLVGGVTVFFYGMIHLADKWVMDFLAHHSQHVFLPLGRIMPESFTREFFCDAHRWLMLGLPCVGAVLGWWLISSSKRVELARGTDSAVHAFHHNEKLSPLVLPIKSTASVLTVGLGGSAGYEGPVTLLGAACGSVLTRMLHLNERASRILLAAGLGAGIAALFRAPFAGAIFGSEIFYSSSDLEGDTIMPSVVASSVSYTVFACVWGWEPLFSMPSYAFESVFRLIPYFVLALVVTFGARFYITCFRGAERLFSSLITKGWLRVMVGGLLTGILGFVFPDVLGTSYSMIRAALYAGEIPPQAIGALGFWSFAIFFVVKVLATSCTVGSGGSGGVFAPAIVCGGALGAAVGLFFKCVLPISVGVHPGAFALVGMAGFLASSIRVPLTAVVMVAEISGNHALLLPTMWVVGITFWLNNGWSLYRSQVHSRTSSPLYK